LAAKSNPCNEYSIPKDTTVHLTQGFNFVSIPAEVMFRRDLRDWLIVLGGETVFEKVLAYDALAGKYVTLVPGTPASPEHILQGGEGLIVYALQDDDLPFTSALCAALDLTQGANVIGIACPPDGFSAYDLLTVLGSENVVSIQRYSTENGMFETAGFDDSGQLNGIDFEIVPGEGYFIFMKQEMLSIRF